MHCCFKVLVVQELEMIKFSLLLVVQNKNINNYCTFSYFCALNAASSLSPCSFVRWIDSSEKSTTLTMRSRWAIEVMSRPTDESKERKDRRFLGLQQTCQRK